MSVLEDPNAPKEDKEQALKILSQPASFKKPLPDDAYRTQLPDSQVDPASHPGMIVGAGVVGIKKKPDGTYAGREFLTSAWANLTVLGRNPDSARIDTGNKTNGKYWLVEHTSTTVWQC